MDTQSFHHWLAQLSQLSPQQRTALNQALQRSPSSVVLDGLPALQSCPHCQAEAEHLAPWGGREAYVVIAVAPAGGRVLRCQQQAFPACITPSAGRTMRRH